MSRTDKFEHRVSYAQIYEDETKEYFESLGYRVFNFGAEHMHPVLQYALIESNDATSLFFKHLPDFAYFDGETLVLYDAKLGGSINREAYLAYMNLFKIGCTVLICVRNKKDEEYHVPVQDLKLLYGRSMYIPIINGWYCPREMDSLEYMAWQSRTRGSGAAYRYIDFEAIGDYKIE